MNVSTSNTTQSGQQERTIVAITQVAAVVFLVWTTVDNALGIVDILCRMGQQILVPWHTKPG